LTNFARFKLSISFPYIPTTTEEQARTFSLGYLCLCESQQPEPTQCKNHEHEEILCQHGQEFDKTTTSTSEGTSVHDLDVRKVENTFSLGLDLVAGYGLALWLIAPLWRFPWTRRALKVGGLLCCMERVLRLAWEDFALVPLFINSGANEMICSIVTIHARKRIS
jgi:hypothetical protein